MTEEIYSTINKQKIKILKSKEEKWESHLHGEINTRKMARFLLDMPHDIE